MSGNAVRGLLQHCELSSDIIQKLENHFPCTNAAIEQQQKQQVRSSCPLEMVQAALKSLLCSTDASPLWLLFSRIVILTVCVQQHLDLRQRALLPPRSFESDALIQYLDELFMQCHTVPLAPDSPLAHVELFDVTLLLHLLLRLADCCGTFEGQISRLLELSPPLLRECSRIWMAISSDRPWDISLETKQVEWLRKVQKFHPAAKRVKPPSADLDDAELCRKCHPAQSDPPPTDIVLFPIHCHVLSSATQLFIPHLSVMSERVCTVSRENQRFFERFHWHSVRPLKHPPQGEKIPPHVQVKLGEFAVRMKAYSASLVGVRKPRFIGQKPVTLASTLPVGLSAQLEEQLSADLDRLPIESADALRCAMRTRSFILHESFLDRYAALKRLRERLCALYPIESMRPLVTRIDVDLYQMATHPNSTAPDPMTQLCFCGEFMNWRDPPMPASQQQAYMEAYGIVPEKWQMEMIKAIDRRSSVIVSAPTSSGKTFISFYVIESVLKSDPRAAIAFVLPTKALVNQVYAEIVGSFSVSADHPYELAGLFTADNRVNVDKCSVLVTVPQALEILLLSPEKSPCMSRLKYVILDEAHSIADPESGIVWEHILSLITCPFLALSATMTNIETFVEWSRSLRKHSVEIITHSERSNFQRILSFNLERQKKEKKKNKEKEAIAAAIAESTQVHIETPQSPYFSDVYAVSLNTLQTMKHGISMEWKLLPAQILNLYAALEGCFSPLPAVDDLRGRLLTRLDYRERYALLCCVCIIKAGDKLPTANSTLLSMLFENTKDSITSSQMDVLRGHIADFNARELPLSSLLALLRPSLFFGGLAEVFKNEVSLYDILIRRFCVAAANDPRLFTAFLKLNPPTTHVKPFLLTPQIPKVLRALQREDMLPAIVFTFDRDLCDRFCQEATDALPFPSTDVNTTNTLTEAVLGLKKVASYPMDWQMKSLLAGYAVHHAGCPDEYKMEVERLFRAKCLRVIFATGTLALGIHMPCKTVVIAGASPYLTSVSMRQLAGRAGRRGFDSIGNVVFLGVGLPVIRSLMLGPLQAVQGSLPVSCTYLLRLLMHVDGKNSGPEFDAVVRQLRQPLFTFGDSTDLFAEQLRHHIRFSLEFLLREGYLDDNGYPLQWAGLLTHLHYAEPSNFILLRWMRKGLLHDIARLKDIPLRRIAFIHVLSTIFQMEPIHHSAPKQIRLLPLPESFQREVQEHNEYVLQVLQLYLRALVRSSPLASYVERMPLSNVFLEPEQRLPSNEPILGYLTGLLQVPAEIRSVYYCLLGISDSYRSAEDLVATARSDLLLDVSLLPVFQRPAALNNHLLAYFRHRQLERIVRHNCISAGDYARFSEGFFKIIKKICTSVKLQSPEDDILRTALEDLKDAYLQCRTQPPLPYAPLPVAAPVRVPKPKQKKSKETSLPSSVPSTSNRNPFEVLLESDE